MPPFTRAESSGFTETSRHADVMAFIAALEHPTLHVSSFGQSPEGRELPLLVLSKDGLRTPMDFAEQLLTKAHVAVVPGEAFGTDKHVRISYAASMEDLTKGLDRIHKFIVEA